MMVLSFTNPSRESNKYCNLHLFKDYRADYDNYVRQVENLLWTLGNRGWDEHHPPSSQPSDYGSAVSVARYSAAVEESIASTRPRWHGRMSVHGAAA